MQLITSKNRLWQGLPAKVTSPAQLLGAGSPTAAEEERPPTGLYRGSLGLPGCWWAGKQPPLSTPGRPLRGRDHLSGGSPRRTRLCPHWEQRWVYLSRGSRVLNLGPALSCRSPYKPSQGFSGVVLVDPISQEPVSHSWASPSARLLPRLLLPFALLSSFMSPHFLFTPLCFPD